MMSLRKAIWGGLLLLAALIGGVAYFAHQDNLALKKTIAVDERLNQWLSGLEVLATAEQWDFVRTLGAPERISYSKQRLDPKVDETVGELKLEYLWSHGFQHEVRLVLRATVQGTEIRIRDGNTFVTWH
jgi:hypothetical protein